MTTPSVITAATCLGCGCTCDDIEVVLDRSTIVDTRNACALGRQWFGTGAAPMRVRLLGVDAPLDTAVERAATLLLEAARPRVLLALDMSCETYREVVACADLLGARLDIVSSAPAMAAALAIQERGIATATLGEIRNRADLIVFWGVDPSAHVPRYESRYAPGPPGVHVPDGRRSRTVIAVDVGDTRGPVDADMRVAVDASAEVDTLIALAALLAGAPGPAHDTASLLATHLRGGRYVVIVADVESGDDRDPDYVHRLLALGHALNVSSRGALSLLRSGGNRCGAEAVVTSQTGYPGAVDFSSGVPRYRPHADASRAAHDVVLMVGSPAQLHTSDVETVGSGTAIMIGPRASEGAFAQAPVVIDSATAGIHSAGTAVRMDDVPIPLTRLVAGPPDATAICHALLRRLQQGRDTG